MCTPGCPVSARGSSRSSSSIAPARRQSERVVPIPHSTLAANQSSCARDVAPVTRAPTNGLERVNNGHSEYLHAEACHRADRPRLAVNSATDHGAEGTHTEKAGRGRSDGGNQRKRRVSSERKVGKVGLQSFVLGISGHLGQSFVKPCAGRYRRACGAKVIQVKA